MNNKWIYFVSSILCTVVSRPIVNNTYTIIFSNDSTFTKNESTSNKDGLHKSIVDKIIKLCVENTSKIQTLNEDDINQKFNVEYLPSLNMAVLTIPNDYNFSKLTDLAKNIDGIEIISNDEILELQPRMPSQEEFIRNSIELPEKHFDYDLPATVS